MQIVRRIPYYGSLLLVAYMPFHIFLSQSLSLLTGGLDEWKIAKDVLLASITIITVFTVWHEHKTTRLFSVLLSLTIAYGIVLLGVWAGHPHIYRTSAILGTAYDIRLFCYALIGYGSTLLTTVDKRFILRFILIVGTIEATLGLVQYILPSNLLTHVGYSVARGVRPNFFIDNNSAFPRIMSTIRDPNSLGAYLLVPIAMLVALCLRARDIKRKSLTGGLLIIQLIAVYLTFSRSAWAGTVIVILLIVGLQYHALFIRFAKRFWPLLAILILLAGGGAYAERHNPIITHQTNKQIGGKDSNQFHLFYAQEGLRGIYYDPLGHGPGTAGVVSIQNPHGGLLTEDYYIQIGYEAGIVGLLLFIGMQVLVYVEAWSYRHNYLGLILVVTFWAYIPINLVLQQWDNEAVAAQWWILAGFVLGLREVQAKEHEGLSPAVRVK